MSKSKSSFQDQQIYYNQLAAEKRGFILNLVINLEKAIDWRISQYFSQRENIRLELEELIISQLSLSIKIKAVVSVLKKYDKEIFIVHAKLEKDLENIRIERNKMAHSWLDVSAFLNGKISTTNLEILNLKSKGKNTMYDDKKIASLSSKILKYTNILLQWKVTRQAF